MVGDDRFKPAVWQAPDAAVGRVLVLPGGGYTVDHPLLFWACHVADSAGWQVCTMHWRPDPDQLGGNTAFVESGADRLAAAAPPHGRTVVIGKSLGTLAAGWANRHGYPGIWLTPLLHDDAVRTALAAAPSALLVGGTADRLWDGEVAASLGCDVVEVDGADHALIIGGDWHASLTGLATTLTSIETFLGTIAEQT
jgi:hypothetical protein